jgi:hypothetical protein
VGGLHLISTEHGVNVELKDVSGVDSIKSDRLHLKISASWHIWELVLDWISTSLGLVANTGAEVGGLVHIEPQAIESNFVLEVAEPLLPPGVGVLSEEIWEGGIIWPNLSGEDLLLSVDINLDEDVIVNTIGVSFIALGSLGETSIDDWDVVHVLGVEVLHEVWKILEVHWVVNEVLIVVHPVDVGPLGVKRNTSLGISLNHGFESIGVVVTPLALVPAESPLRDEDWKSNDGVVLLGNSVGIITHHEVDVASSTNSISADSNISVSRLISLEPPVLSSGQIGEDTEPGTVGGLSHVKWMSSIQVVARRLGSLDWVGSVQAPEGEDTVWEEDIGSDSLEKSHNTLGSLLGDSSGVHEVEILAEDHSVESPHGGAGSILDRESNGTFSRWVGHINELAKSIRANLVLVWIDDVKWYLERSTR